MDAQLICDRAFENHDTGVRHPEKPERITAIHRGYESVQDPCWDWINPVRKATHNELLYYHTEDHVNRVRSSSEDGRSLDADTPTSSQSYETALLAAGSALRLTDFGLDESGKGFGAIRPPGHHAEADRGMGFCLFNNIVLAAEHVTRQNQSVAIVDIDVHHGNGTQDAFYDRSDVLYVSTHQFPFYPGTGDSNETGTGDGTGFTLNVTLPGGSDWSDLEPKWEKQVKKKIIDFDPNFLMVSAGFDAHRTDPIGGLNLHDEAFLRIARDLNRLSVDLCQGRIMGLLEGGYNLETLERLVPEFTSELIGNPQKR